MKKHVKDSQINNSEDSKIIFVPIPNQKNYIELPFNNQYNLRPNLRTISVLGSEDLVILEDTF